MCKEKETGIRTQQDTEGERYRERYRPCPEENVPTAMSAMENMNSRRGVFQPRVQGVATPARSLTQDAMSLVEQIMEAQAVLDGISLNLFGPEPLAEAGKIAGADGGDGLQYIIERANNKMTRLRTHLISVNARLQR